MKQVILASAICIAVNSYGQNFLKIGAGTTLKTSGNTIITLSDMDLVNDGIIEQSYGDGGFRFSGAEVSSISGTNPIVFDRLQMAKTAGGMVNLLQEIYIARSIDFSSGLLDLNNHIITLSSAGLLNGESETSRIIGPLGGSVMITVYIQGPADPGNLGAYISSTYPFGKTVMSRGHKKQDVAGGIANSISRYYDIFARDNHGISTTLRFNYFDAELNAPEFMLELWKSNSITSFNWTNEGSIIRNPTLNYVQRSWISNFGRFTLYAPTPMFPLIVSSHPKK